MGNVFLVDENGLNIPYKCNEFYFVILKAKL